MSAFIKSNKAKRRESRKKISNLENIYKAVPMPNGKKEKKTLQTRGPEKRKKKRNGSLVEKKKKKGGVLGRMKGQYASVKL